MAVNLAKRRMLAGEPAVGAEVGLGSPLAAEYLSPEGFDFILVDNQHGAWDDDTTMQAFRSIALGQAVPMTRVRYNDFSAIGRLLDRGAMGVILPMVNSVEEAQAAAHAARYPPRGGRSNGAFGAQFLGPDYMSWIDDELFLAVQIESKQAAERAEQIMAVEGVDGCWIGPGDLSYSMGIDLNTAEGREAHQAAIRGIIKACHNTGKIPGISVGDAETAQHWIDEGCLFVTTGADSGFMMDGAQQALRYLGRLP